MTLALYGKTRRRQSLLGLAAILAVVLGLAAAIGANDGPARATGGTGTATLKAEHVGTSTVGADFDADCGPYTGAFDYAFHFVFQGSSTDFTGIDAQFTGGSQVYEVWDGKHAYVYVDDTGAAGVTLTGASATTMHNGGRQELDSDFNLSHICEGEGAGTGTIEIVKHVDNTPAGGVDPYDLTPADFAFSIEGSIHTGVAAGSYTVDAGGTYSVTEDDAQGYTVHADGCANIAVAAGQTYTCTITNTAPQPQTQTTTVTLTKECFGLAHVAVQFEVGTQFSALNQDCGAQYHVEVTGTTALINEHLRGTAIASITCNGSQHVALAPEGYTLTLLQGQDNECTIVNHAPNAPTTVTVTKECFGLAHVAVQFQVGTQFSALNQDCGAQYHVEVTGTTALINEHLRGTAIASITCNGSQHVALAPEGYTLTLLQDQDNECTIVNHAPNAPTTVTVTKECFGLAHVAVQFQVGTHFSALNQDCGAQYHVEVTGTTALINEHLRGAAIASITCNGSQHVALAPEGYTLTLLQGQDNECTIVNHAPPAAQYTVTVNKLVGGLPPTSGSFSLTSTWTAANLSGGLEASGNFTLESGNAYSATTSMMDSGYDYTVVENGVDATCDAGDTYRLLGYRIDGGSLAATAEITNGIANHTITVENALCQQQVAQYTVTVQKYVDGLLATDGSFDLTSTWTAANLNGGAEASGNFSLNAGNSFVATTSAMDSGYDYTVVENVIDYTCDAGDTYRLVGYQLDGGSVTTLPAEIDNGVANHTITVHNELCEDFPHAVTITKYLDNEVASVPFDLLITYDGFAQTSGGVDLGHISDPDGEAFVITGTATSVNWATGFDYAVEEVGVDGSCDPGDDYALEGYSWSTVSMDDAAGLAPVSTIPSIVDGNSDYYIAIHNVTCVVSAGPYTVTIGKFLDGLVPEDGVGSPGTELEFAL